MCSGGRCSQRSGAGNALSEVLYGTGPIKGVKDAFLRGAGVGAVSSRLRNIGEALWPEEMPKGRGAAGAGIPGHAGRDPRKMCGSPDPFDLAETLGNRKISQGGAGYGGGFSLGGFLKDVAIGGIVGGLGSAAFYGAGEAVDALKRHFAENAYFIRTPYGIAFQSNTKEARQVRKYIKQGGMVYRGGEFGNSKIADAQFWAPESPLTFGYAEKYGVVFGQMDYIIGGYVKDGSKFITRPAPGMGTNVGGAIEIVTPPNSVDLQYFYMLGE